MPGSKDNAIKFYVHPYSAIYLISYNTYVPISVLHLKFHYFLLRLVVRNVNSDSDFLKLSKLSSSVAGLKPTLKFSIFELE